MYVKKTSNDFKVYRRGKYAPRIVLSTTWTRGWLSVSVFGRVGIMPVFEAILTLPQRREGGI